MQNITIIDGHNYLFRAYYGVPEAARTPSGIQVNAVYGFFAFLRQIVAAFPANKVFVVFDSETGIQDKLEVKEEYKAERVVDTNMFKQLPLIKQILDLMNIKWLEHPKFEADDIIASLATQWSERFGAAYISSNDFDFVQLVSPNIILIRAAQGKLIDCDQSFIKQKFNIDPSQYVEYLSMVGDKTDNIAGVDGIGKKTASDLLGKHGSIDKIFANISVMSPGMQQKLINGKATIEQNKRFISMKTDIPAADIIPQDLPSLDPAIVQKKIAFYLEKIDVR